MTFLAVLELLRRRKVDVEQDTTFGDILILPVSTPPADGAAIDDNEESEFEIPKVAEEEAPAQEFEFTQPPATAEEEAAQSESNS